MSVNRTISERTRSKKLSEFLIESKKRSPKRTSDVPSSSAKPKAKRVQDDDDDDGGIEILYREPSEVDTESEGMEVNEERIEAGEGSSKQGDKEKNKLKAAEVSSEKVEARNEASKCRSEVKIYKRKEKKVSELPPVEAKRNDVGRSSQTENGDVKKNNKEAEAKPSLKKSKIDGKKANVEKKNNEAEAKQKINVSRRSEGKIGDMEKKNKEVETKRNRQPPAKERKINVGRSVVIKKDFESESSGDDGENNDVSDTRSEGMKEVKKPKKKAAEAEAEQRNVNRRIEAKKEDKKQKKKEVESKGQRNGVGKQRSEGKIDDKKQKKKVVEVEDDEESEKSETALYKFPMNRISRILKSEDFNNRITQEAIFVINKASEKFLELISKEAYAGAFLDHKNHVAYNHIASVVSKRRRFDFLSDFVPQKVKAEDALAEMSKAET